MSTLGVFAMIFNEDDQLLCVRMNYATHDWTTPGGRVNAGESPLNALKREVLEETGYQVEPKELIGVYAKPFEDDIVMSFEALVVSRNEWVPNEEISEVKWFHPSELPPQMSLIVQTRVQDAVARRRGVFRVFHSPDKPHDT